MKNSVLLIVCLATMSLTLTSQISARIDPADLGGAWLFDEEDAELIEDISGNENSGVVFGKPHWEDGKFGKAILLNGANEYINCGTQESLAVGLGDFSIVAWLSTAEDAGSWAATVVGKFDTNAPRHGYLFGIRGDLDAAQKNNPLFLMGLGQGSGAHLFGTDSIVDDEWHHIAATADRDGDAIFYRDGVFEAKMDISADAKQDETNAQDFNIGADANSRWYLNGLLDEVAFFNTALTEDDVKRIMNDGLERVLGLTPVSSAGKLTSSWGSIKAIAR